MGSHACAHPAELLEVWLGHAPALFNSTAMLDSWRSGAEALFGGAKALQ